MEIEINACYRDREDGEVVRALEQKSPSHWTCLIVRSGHGYVSRPGDVVARNLDPSIGIWSRVPDPTLALRPEPEAKIQVDGVPLSLDERQVYLAAFGSAAADEVAQPAVLVRDHARTRASSAVRVFRMAVTAGLLGLLALVGCTGVHAPIDAGARDAPLRNGCLDLFNTWQTYAPPGCEATSCPFVGPVSQAEIDWCNQGLYAARGTCETMQAALEACR